MNPTVLPRTLVNSILHQAQSSPETEVCGLIAATNGRPIRCIAVTNVAEQPERLFAMDPKQQIAALRTIRENGETLFGIYHSHPHAPAMPSDTDLQQAGYPDAMYFIVSLNTEGVLEMRGYCLHDGRAQEQPLEIVD